MYKLACLRVMVPTAAVLLSACGGGAGSVAPVPPPPALTYNTMPLTTSASFETIAGERSYTVPAGNNRTIGDFQVYGRNSGVNISFDAATGSYTVKDSGATVTFDSAGRSTSDYFDSYASASGTSADELRLYSNIRSGSSQAGAPIDLTYLSFGSWSHDDTVTGQSRDTYFVFGSPTVNSNMPVSGTASYKTFVDANVVSILRGEGESLLKGSATFTADFGKGTVDTVLTLPLPNYGSPNSNFDGSGTISGNQFSGNFTKSDDPTFHSGQFAGGFFGPSAQEMGYTFTLSRGAADPYAGAAVEPPLVWIVGAAVGTKTTQ